jgi:hypothetical protein
MKQHYIKTLLSNNYPQPRIFWMNTAIVWLLVLVFHTTKAQIGIVQNSNSQTLSQLLAGTGGNYQ